MPRDILRRTGRWRKTLTHPVWTNLWVMQQHYEWVNSKKTHKSFDLVLPALHRENYLVHSACQRTLHWKSSSWSPLIPSANYILRCYYVLARQRWVGESPSIQVRTLSVCELFTVYISKSAAAVRGMRRGAGDAASVWLCPPIPSLPPPFTVSLTAVIHYTSHFHSLLGIYARLRLSVTCRC